MKDFIIVRNATIEDLPYSISIAEEMRISSLKRGTGIGNRTDKDIEEIILSGNAMIAVTKDQEWVGFIYLKVWENEQYISHCGLIVSNKWRRMGIGWQLKKALFNMSRTTYPNAKIFGITTTLATMKINLKLGMSPVTYSEIVHSPEFWNKCKGCIHHNILESNNFEKCFCTAMLFDPKSVETIPKSTIPKELVLVFKHKTYT